MSHLIAEWALLEDGFAPDIRVCVEDGVIVSVEPAAGRPGESVAGALLPGMTDLHSHAFQRSFAGRAEFAGGGSDFWSWREAMYRAADRIEPETLAPIAAYLGMEKLRGGYTSLTEFHYLHHGRGGIPYADRNAMAHALVAGAREAGIGMTLLFGLYESSGFGGAALEPGQARFANGAADALAMLAAMREAPDLRLGLAPHSLRAVRPDSLLDAVAGLAALDPSAPVHIHVAEQVAEVEACMASLGAAPVTWLLDHAPVGPNWCLIHATHATAAECAAVARTGAVVGLCPSTEGNLGDGIFALLDFRAAGGRFGIGTDSNVCLDAFAELRLIEYVQRLSARKRNVLVRQCHESSLRRADSVRLARHGGRCPPYKRSTQTKAFPADRRHSGRVLWQSAALGGAAAGGRKVGRIAAGYRADFVVIGATPETSGDGPDFWLDAAVFAQDGRAARHVMAGGRWAVRDFVHVRQEPIEAAYRAALARLG